MLNLQTQKVDSPPVEISVVTAKPKSAFEKFFSDYCSLLIERFWKDSFRTVNNYITVNNDGTCSAVLEFTRLGEFNDQSFGRPVITECYTFRYFQDGPFDASNIEVFLNGEPIKNELTTTIEA